MIRARMMVFVCCCLAFLVCGVPLICVICLRVLSVVCRLFVVRTLLCVV